MLPLLSSCQSSCQRAGLRLPRKVQAPRISGLNVGSSRSSSVKAFYAQLYGRDSSSTISVQFLKPVQLRVVVCTCRAIRPGRATSRLLGACVYRAAGSRVATDRRDKHQHLFLETSTVCMPELTCVGRAVEVDTRHHATTGTLEVWTLFSRSAHFLIWK